MTIEEILEAARRRIVRLTPEQAASAWNGGGVLVDIRPASQREAEGELPGALIIERNVLEWRFDPWSEARLPIADLRVTEFFPCRQLALLADHPFQKPG